MEVKNFFLKQAEMVRNLPCFEDCFLHLVPSMEVDLMNIEYHW